MIAFLQGIIFTFLTLYILKLNFIFYKNVFILLVTSRVLAKLFLFLLGNDTEM